MLSDVEEAHVGGVALDERAASIDVVAHEDREGLVGVCGLVEGDLLEDSALRIHGGFPQFVVVHFAQALVALDATFLGEAAVRGAAVNRRLPKEGGIQRYKGLGEMNDHELWETTMDPERRILKQVTLDEAADADETFTILMGDDVDRRRTFIQRNATDVSFLDI